MLNPIRKLAPIDLKLASYDYILAHKDEVYLVQVNIASRTSFESRANILFISEHVIVFKYIDSPIEVSYSRAVVNVFMLSESTLKVHLIDRLIKSFAYSFSEQEVAEKTIDRIIDMGYRPTIEDSDADSNKDMLELIDSLAGALTILYSEYKQFADSDNSRHWKLEDTVAGALAVKEIEKYNEFKSNQSN